MAEERDGRKKKERNNRSLKTCRGSVFYTPGTVRKF